MLTVRAARAPDLPTLAHLWHEKMVLHADRRTAPAANARDAWVAAAQGWLADERCGFFAAEHDDAVIGYIVGWLQPMAGVSPAQIGLITDLALDAHGYHGGAGRALVGALRDWFEARGASQMAVWTPHLDAVSQAFWRSLGAAEWMDVLWIK
jgi:GNAT superfamily N-acetyltransferase